MEIDKETKPSGNEVASKSGRKKMFIGIFAVIVVVVIVVVVLFVTGVIGGAK